MVVYGQSRVFLTRAASGLQLRTFKYDHMDLRHALLVTDTKYKKQKEYADLGEGVAVENEGLCKACEIEDTKKFVQEKEKPTRKGKSVQGEDMFRSPPGEIEGFGGLEKEYRMGR